MEGTMKILVTGATGFIGAASPESCCSNAMRGMRGSDNCDVVQHDVPCSAHAFSAPPEEPSVLGNEPDKDFTDFIALDHVQATAI
jgi:hypothetical protein